MLNSYKTKSYCLFFALTLLFACSKSETPNPSGGGNTGGTASITVSNESNVGETEFTANWSVNKTGISSIKLQVALTDEFTNLIKDLTVPTTNTSIEVSGLTGASTYYYKITINFTDNTNVTSSVESVNTSFETEAVSFTTSDGYLIKGEIAYLASNTTAKPGLIMMHEFGQSKSRWTNTSLTKLRNRMLAEGYVCLAFNFRGHGDSEAFDRDAIFTNLGLVAPDLTAAIDFMKNREEVNGDKLALIGASIGGIMAVAGNGYDEVKTTVALSPIRRSINSIFPNLSINSAFYIAGDQDKRDVEFGDSQVESTYLHSITNEPKKITILSSGEHGVDLLNEEVETEIIEWVNSQIEI